MSERNHSNLIVRDGVHDQIGLAQQANLAGYEGAIDAVHRNKGVRETAQRLDSRECCVREQHTTPRFPLLVPTCRFDKLVECFVIDIEYGASRVGERSVDPLSRIVEIDSRRLTTNEPFDSLFDCSRPGQRPLSGILGIATFQAGEELRRPREPVPPRGAPNRRSTHWPHPYPRRNRNPVGGAPTSAAMSERLDTAPQGGLGGGGNGCDAVTYRSDDGPSAAHGEDFSVAENWRGRTDLLAE